MFTVCFFLNFLGSICATTTSGHRAASILQNKVVALHFFRHCNRWLDTERPRDMAPAQTLKFVEKTKRTTGCTHDSTSLLEACLLLSRPEAGPRIPRGDFGMPAAR